MTDTKIALFASGAGSNAKKLIEHFGSTIRVVVCNNPNAGVLNIATQNNIPVILIEKERFTTTGYINELKDAGVNFIILAGFLWQLPVQLIKEYDNRIINIHPALLPAYGGKGMYGNKVHNAVLVAGDKKSGITIHLVNEDYDRGKLLFQATCIINRDDTPETLAQKVHALEHRHYPKIAESVIRSL
ncbi:phosphoribosylglycinamide formyltransferase [soil metagenome]